MKTHFEELVRKILKTRRPGEHFLFSFSGEKSQFTRINGSKIRQTGTVEDSVLEICLLIEVEGGKLKQACRGFTLSGLTWLDWERTENVLKALRAEVPLLPVDDFAELPKGNETGAFEKKGELLSTDEVPSKLLGGTAKNLDVAGIYASGPIYRGMANSLGQFLWFSSENFSFDFSVYTDGHRAVKSGYAGSKWSSEEFEKELVQVREKLALLKIPAKQIVRGKYRTYLAPSALNDLVLMLSWGCISEAAVQQGDSPLRKVRAGEAAFSPLFSLSEDFREGLVPRFNDVGEIAPENLPLIEKGELKNTLISSRTAKEYKLTMNGACSAEVMRSPCVAPGSLQDGAILDQLGEGLYLSNLHYLNWSDQQGGRITGMTRYACFWVEKGRMVAPIENLRWDDSIFNLMGSNLEALTAQSAYNPDVGTYEMRSLGGVQTPGALLSEMAFTL